MLPVQITLTPTMLIFNNLTETKHLHLIKELELVYNDKGYYFLKGKPQELFQVLLKLSYNYDIEIY